MQQLTELVWNETNKEMIEGDEHILTYKDKGWNVYLSIPNGGIIGVDVVSPQGRCYYACTDEFEVWADEVWHIEQAKLFIDNYKPKQFVIIYQMGANLSVKTLPLDITREQAEDIAKEEERRALRQSQIVPEIRLIEAEIWEHESNG